MDRNSRAEYLVRTYADTILRLGYTYLKNRDDAADVCQEVLMKAMDREEPFQSPEHEKAWLLRVTANACKDVLKSPWRARVCALDQCAEAAAPEAEPEGEVLSAVNDLPELYRTVLYLYYYEGYQAREIAEILGVPAATVHTRLARGREKLKTVLGGFSYGASV